MIVIRNLGMSDYLQTWQDMKSFTQNRTDVSTDEVWLLEHPSVYTQGQAGKAEHVLNSNNIPIVQSDRGGQVTYHGPGQLVAYFLINIKRRSLGIRDMVTSLEELLIRLLKQFSIKANTIPNAPGVYVDNNKVASIGLRVKNGCTYHGIALNVDMDLSPFRDINPCGFSSLQMTQVKEYYPTVTMGEVTEIMETEILNLF